MKRFPKVLWNGICREEGIYTKKVQGENIG